MLRTGIAALLVLAAIVAGVVLRVVALAEPLWLDEMHTSWCVVDSFASVANRAMMGNQSPLFFWIDYVAFHTLGGNEFALRAPSLLAAIGLLISIPWIVFRLSGCVFGAILATLLAALDDQFVFYAVEARPYAVLQLVAVWQVYWFARIMFPQTDGNAVNRQRWKFPMLWGVAAVGLFYLHYTTILLTATQLLISLVVIRWNRGTGRAGEFRSWMIISCLSGLAFVPGLTHLFIVNEKKAIWHTMVDADRYGLMMIALVVIYLLPIVLLCLLPRRERLSRSTSALTTTLILLATLPMLFCFLGAVSRQAPLAHYRFSIASSTVLILAAGVLFPMLGSARRKLIAAGLISFLAMATNPLIASWLGSGIWPSQRKENWSEVVETMRSTTGPVIFCPNLVEDADGNHDRDEAARRNYYSFALQGIYPIDEPRNPSRQILAVPIRQQAAQLNSVDIDSLVRSASQYWLLVRAWPEDAEQIAESLRVSLQGALQDDSGKKELRMERAARAPLNLFRIFIIGNDQNRAIVLRGPR